MDTNLALQYSLVALLILGAIAWIVRNLTRKDKRSSGSCAGCSLAESCKDYRKNRESQKILQPSDNNHPHKKDCHK